MNRVENDGKQAFRLSSPALGLVLIAVALIVAGSWLASSMGGNMPKIGPQDFKPYVPNHVTTAPPPMEPDYNSKPQVKVTVVPSDPPLPEVQAPRISPAPIPKPKPSVRDMFPMGDVAAESPRVDHPYREMPESYESFSYQGKIWSATGRFATADELDLTPVGIQENGQDIYAIAGDEGQNSALFMPSSKYPDVYVIYRPEPLG